MNIGICFGGYYPLHRGHMKLIMDAKKFNDITYVFVCGCNNDRGNNQMPLSLRYSLIKDFLEDDILKVKKINDDDLGIDESMSDENWQIWLKYLHTQIDYSSNDNINWYIGEKDYERHIKAFSNTENVNIYSREIIPISGTIIRDNPIKYWDYISKPFKPYLCKNILVVGTASEGKTTLCEDISKYYDIPFSYEKGRDRYTYDKTDKEFDFEDFMYNIYEQNNANLELRKKGKPFTISDSDNCVTLMYALAYSQREDFSLTCQQYLTLYNTAKEYSKNIKWDKIFLVPPSEKGIVDDGQRYMPDSDYKIRKKFYENLKIFLKDFGYEYEELKNNYLENFNRVCEYIEGELK